MARSSAVVIRVRSAPAALARRRDSCGRCLTTLREVGGVRTRGAQPCGARGREPQGKAGEDCRHYSLWVEAPVP
jgi:hypothetical protein